MYFYMYIFFFLYIVNETLSKRWTPPKQTTLGTIIGSYKISYSGRKYEAYEGVPYAKPPTNEKRFQPPQQFHKWEGILIATNSSYKCVEYLYKPIYHTAIVRGREDCLYLNIYVPTNNSKKLLPVLFFIPAGAFQYGAALNNVSFLMDKDVILVSANYRLGILGFLSTEDEHIPGNMGLKDQSMALRWTYDNIDQFGGDPKRITLIGNSAGAASVHFHYLSPLSKGLFQNGISFSGSSLSAGSIQNDSIKKFKKLGAIFDCPSTTISETVECLRMKPVSPLMKATKEFMFWLGNPAVPFGPVIEKAGKQPFIDRSPIEIITSGDAANVPWIAGIVSEEGLIPAAEFIKNETHLKELDKNWNKIAPHLLMYNFTIPLERQTKVAEQIRKHYLKNKKIEKSTRKALISLIGDGLYVNGIIRAAKLQAQINSSSVFLWYYSYRAATSLSDFMMEKPTNLGVCHADDMLMIIDNPVIYPPRKSKDRQLQSKLIDFVVSVAENGYPSFGTNFEWKKINPIKDKLDLLHIAGPDNIKMMTRRNFGEYEFWSSIDLIENQNVSDNTNNVL